MAVVFPGRPDRRRSPIIRPQPDPRVASLPRAAPLHGFGRRDFLNGSAFLTGGAVLAACGGISAGSAQNTGGVRGALGRAVAGGAGRDTMGLVMSAMGIDPLKHTFEEHEEAIARRRTRSTRTRSRRSSVPDVCPVGRRRSVLSMTAEGGAGGHSPTSNNGITCDGRRRYRRGRPPRRSRQAVRRRCRRSRPRDAGHPRRVVLRPARPSGGRCRRSRRSTCGRSSTPAWPRSPHWCSATHWPTSSRTAPDGWRNVFLLLVVMPLLVSFLVRTLAWKIMLADQGLVVEGLKGDRRRTSTRHRSPRSAR